MLTPGGRDGKNTFTRPGCLVQDFLVGEQHAVAGAAALGACRPHLRSVRRIATPKIKDVRKKSCCATGSALHVLAHFTVKIIAVSSFEARADQNIYGVLTCSVRMTGVLEV